MRCEGATGSTVVASIYFDLPVLPNCNEMCQIYPAEKYVSD